MVKTHLLLIWLTKCNMEIENWKNANKYPDYPEKQCEAVGCEKWFKPKWKGERRCQECRKAKKPYKTN